MQGDKDEGSIHNVMRRFLPVVLCSQAAKSDIKATTTILTIPREKGYHFG